MTGAKEVGVRNPAEETVWHRTITFIAIPVSSRQPFFAILHSYFDQVPGGLHDRTD